MTHNHKVVADHSDNTSRAKGYVTLKSVLWFIIGLITVSVSLGKWFVLGDTPQREVVVLTHDLPAFTFIRNEDVELQMVLDPPSDALTDTTSVLGRIQLVVQTKGSPVQTSTTIILPDPQWNLLTVPLTNTVALRSGDRVVVVGVRYGQPAETVSEEGLIIGHQGRGVIVALPPDQAEVAARYLLPNHQLILLQRYDNTGTQTSP